MALTERDLLRLNSCHHRLQALFEVVERFIPLMILEGHRGEKEQNAAFADGKSKLRWPNGKHNTFPSLAVDAAPLPLDWQNREAFIYFAGIVQAVAWTMGQTIRWGGDWDQDRSFKDETFVDLVHYELVLPAPISGKRIA